MQSIYSYKPIQFFLITILGTWIPLFIAAYLSHQKGKEKLQLLFGFSGLLVPCVVALIMIYASKNSEFIKDFWDRLFIYKIKPSSLVMLLVVVPAVFFLATALSLLFGKSPEQFSIAKEFSVIKGWSILGILIPFLLAPALEEIGWRGYGVDSLRAHFNLFSTSMLFALLWGLWHLPLFFIKGYYNHELWNLNIVYVINYFVSIIPIAIIINWIYYNNSRSILIAILVHSLVNVLSIIFKTEQFTKCIFTIFLCGVSALVVIKDRDFFFKPTLNHQLKAKLDELRSKYGFPGATCAYVLPDGREGGVATGLRDLEDKTAMTPHSRMLAASIGKSFVAATVLQLSKEGRLNLDDPISKWLGDRAWFSRLPNHETITLRHLLTHSSGLPDHVHMNSFLSSYSQSWHDPGNPFQPESLVAFVLDQPPLFEAGKGWMYTDTGYILLGLVIESATKNSYYNEVKERFLKPLHLDETSPSDRPALPHLAAGYTKKDNPFGLPAKGLSKSGLMAWNPAMEFTGGGLVSTSRDLARWSKLLFEGHAMKEKYLDELLRPTTAKEESGLFYGAGVVISEKDPLGLSFGHMGVIPGYTSSIRYYPKYHVAFAFQVNTDVGVYNRSTELFSEMERGLAELIIEHVKA